MTDEIKVSNKPKKPRRTRRAIPAGMMQRGRVYHADFMKNGRRIRKRLSTDLNAAKEMLNYLRSRADKADFDLLDNRYPWADLKKDFIAWAKLKIRRWWEYEADLDAFEKIANVTCISQVTPQLVDRFRSQRLADGVTARTINRQVGTVRNMLTKGADVYKVIATDPLQKLERLTAGDPTKVRRALEVWEVEEIFKHSPADLKPMLRLYCATGMRRNEVVELRFEDVDWENRYLTVRASVAKAKVSREVPIDDETMAMLEKLRDDAASRLDGWDREHVFVNAIGNPHRNTLLERFYVVCKRAKIEGAVPGGSVDLHALRNTFISLALDHGANPKAVQTIVGHKHSKMTMDVYARVTNRSMRATVGALPFAKVTSPAHVLSIDKGQPTSQDSHNCSERETAKVG